MASYVQVANLDFADIKQTLKDYLRSQSEFNSYDFEGSATSVLLDILAYNTYYTAFNTNMVVNELFLDSATLRENVVSIAKSLGYKPKSKKAPVAYVDFRANIADLGAIPSTIKLKKGTGFTTIFDDTLYEYVVIEDQIVPVTGNIANFSTIPIYEGTLITNTYTVNLSLKSQRFVIDNPGVDITTIRVKVFENASSTIYQNFEFSSNILNVTPQTPAFFIEEIEDERYEIFFGDGILGQKLSNGNVIQISYLITNGPDTNGARSFTFNGVYEDLNGSSAYSISTTVTNIVRSDGGEDIEAISSIKYNAPKYFGTQDRAVTAQDYASIITGNGIYDAVADIIVYGGEEERNPEYGKVKIVIKPKAAAVLSTSTKQDIIRKLKPYMVASVTPEIIDPSILYVEMDSKVFYNRSITTDKPEEIKQKVIRAVVDYIKRSDTEKFNGKFRYSKFISVIDNADKSINSNATTITMRKDFYPQINSQSYYEVCYQNKFENPCDHPIVQSTGFVVSEYPRKTVFFQDNAGRVVLYTLDPLSNDKIILNNNIGKIDYEKGEIMIDRLTIIKGTFADNRIEVRVKPFSNDLNAIRNVYLDVDISNSTFISYPE